MAIAKGTRSRARVKSTPRLSTPSVSKPEIYEAIYALNRDLELVIAGFRRLRKLRFRREFMDAFAVKVEELRAGVNVELWETQHNREMRDWTRWGVVSRKFDESYRDPEDVLIEAERLSKKRAKVG